MTAPVKTRVANHRARMRKDGYKYRSYWIPAALVPEADAVIKLLTNMADVSVQKKVND